MNDPQKLGHRACIIWDRCLVRSGGVGDALFIQIRIFRTKAERIQILKHPSMLDAAHSLCNVHWLYSSTRQYVANFTCGEPWLRCLVSDRICVMSDRLLSGVVECVCVTLLGRRLPQRMAAVAETARLRVDYPAGQFQHADAAAVAPPGGSCSTPEPAWRGHARPTFAHGGSEYPDSPPPGQR